MSPAHNEMPHPARALRSPECKPASTLLLVKSALSCFGPLERWRLTTTVHGGLYGTPVMQPMSLYFYPSPESGVSNEDMPSEDEQNRASHEEDHLFLSFNYSDHERFSHKVPSSRR